MSIEEGHIADDVEFLSEILEMNETLENGSEDTLRNLKSQINGKKFLLNSTGAVVLSQFLPPRS